jgi:hypothetical protein
MSYVYPIAQAAYSQIPVPPVEDFLHPLTIEYVPYGGIITRHWVDAQAGGVEFVHGETGTLLLTTNTDARSANTWNKKRTERELTRLYISMLFQGLTNMAAGIKYDFIYVPSMYAKAFDRVDIRTLVNKLFTQLDQDIYHQFPDRDDAWSRQDMVTYALWRGDCKDYLEAYDEFYGDVDNTTQLKITEIRKIVPYIHRILERGLSIIDRSTHSYTETLDTLQRWYDQRFDAPGVPAYMGYCLTDPTIHAPDALSRPKFVSVVHSEIAQLELADLHMSNIIDLSYLSVNIRPLRKLVFTNLATGNNTSIRIMPTTTLSGSFGELTKQKFTEWLPKVQDAKYSQVLELTDKYRVSLVCFGTV